MTNDDFDISWEEEPTRYDLAVDLVTGRVPASEEIFIDITVPLHPAEVEPCPIEGGRKTVEVPAVKEGDL